MRASENVFADTFYEFVSAFVAFPSTYWEILSANLEA